MVIDRDAFRAADRGSDSVRGGPYWVWNDEMSEQVVSDQLTAIREGGWDDAFIQSRPGNSLEWLSEEWFDRHRHAVERADEEGIGLWLQDDRYWSSGYAGGMVTEKGPEYRAQCLALKDDRADRDEVVDTVDHDGETLSIAVMRTAAGAGFGGAVGDDSAGNLLNPAVTETFMDVSHETYADHLGDQFGDTIEGIFTIEPQLCSEPPYDPQSVRAFVPWTPGLPEAFEAEYGYDLLDCLPALFLEVDAAGRRYESVRWDFWRLVTERFVESFSKPLYEWCERHDLKFTGHYQSENTVHEQIACNGAVMPQLQYQHLPAMDHLRRERESRNSNAMYLKQCSSVARQFDRNAWTEFLGATGQSLSFQDRKWLGDWHLVNGVTYLCRHLSLYSMRGPRKRDNPPNLFDQQPYWEYNDRVVGYLSRVAHALRQGDAAVDTLLIHPVQTGWLEYDTSYLDGEPVSGTVGWDPEEPHPVVELHRQFEGLVYDLLGRHVNFDLGDEMILEDHGEVTDDRLSVGDGDYETVVVPYCRTLQSSTVSLLEEFAAGGGTVLVVGDDPTFVDGTPDEGRLEALRSEMTAVEPAAVPSYTNRPLRLVEDDTETADSVYTHVRERGDDLVAFVANTDPDEGASFTLRFDRPGRLTRWDPVTGETAPVEATVREGTTVADGALSPAGSYLLTLDTSERPADAGGSLVRSAPAAGGTDIDGPWAVTRADPNQLVVDRCDLVLDGERHDDTNVAHHWVDRDNLPFIDGTTPFEARYTFQVGDAVAGNEMSVVVESADEQAVRFNGEPVETTGTRWRDHYWRRIDITDAVEPGTNTLTVAGALSDTVSIEPVYVLGEFAVDPDTHELRAEPESAQPADITAAGYPFYTGAVTFETTVDVPTDRTARLTFEEVNACLLLVEVNGGDPREVYWPPWEAPVSLAAGENTLRVTLVTTLRNLTGPHHSGITDPTFVHYPVFDPESARNHGELDLRWDEATYDVLPVGFRSPRLVPDAES
jgi:hypothetical protein